MCKQKIIFEVGVCGGVALFSGCLTIYHHLSGIISMYKLYMVANKIIIVAVVVVVTIACAESIYA